MPPLPSLRHVVRMMDIGIFGGSGLMRGSSIVRHLSSVIPEDADFQHLRRQFGAVAADIRTGREVWLREGLLMDAVRASIAVPGIFTPHLVGNDWLVDGGIVNPVPVSLCRAMGADVVIAVNLNRNLCGRNFRSQRQAQALTVKNAGPTLDEVTSAHILQQQQRQQPREVFGSEFEVDPSASASSSSPSSSWHRRLNSWREKAGFLRDSAGDAATRDARALSSDRSSPPGLLSVMSAALNILQDRVTRSRLAGDPPDVEVCPRLADVDFHQLHRGDHAIEEGARATEKMMMLIKDALDAAR
jgi:NTE family protein